MPAMIHLTTAGGGAPGPATATATAAEEKPAEPLHEPHAPLPNRPPNLNVAPPPRGLTNVEK